MAINYIKATLYVNGAEPAAGKVNGLDNNYTYNPSTGLLTYGTSGTYYVCGCSSNNAQIYITRLEFTTTETIGSFTLSGKTGTSEGNGTRKIVISTDPNLGSLSVNDFAKITNNAFSLWSGSKTSGSINCTNLYIPANSTFYIYFGPEAANKYFSAIYSYGTAASALKIDSTSITPPPSCTVTYVANNGGKDSNSVETYYQGDTIKLKNNIFSVPDPTDIPITLSLNNNGTVTTQIVNNQQLKQFDSWSDGTENYPPQAEYQLTSTAVTFTAQWENGNREFTETTLDEVTKNSLTDPLSLNTILYDDIVQVYNTAKVTNYDFSNWNTSSDGSGTAYYTNTPYTFNNNITLYAQYDSNESINPVLLPILTREGYDFEGWAYEPDGTVKIPNNMYTPSETGETVYATWEQKFTPTGMYIYKQGTWHKVSEFAKT